MADLLEGADSEGYEDFCEEVYNAIKNHFRQSDPCTNVSEKQPGMILSDEDDEKLYHVGLDSYVCDEILQERRSFDAIPIFQSIDLGVRQIMMTTRARAYRNANQSNIADTTWTKVLLDAESYDSGGNFDTGNNRFDPPVNGYYFIIGQIRWQEVVDGARWLAAIYVNGARITVSDHHTGSTEVLSSIVVDLRYVQTGQEIELYCYHNAGVGTPDIYGGADSTYLCVHLLSI